MRDFFEIFWHFSALLSSTFSGFSPKTRLFGKKSGGTPNPPAAGLRRASGGRRENLIRVRGYHHLFDLWVRGTPTFFNRKVAFSSPLATLPDTPPSIKNKSKSRLLLGRSKKSKKYSIIRRKNAEIYQKSLSKSQ